MTDMLGEGEARSRDLQIYCGAPYLQHTFNYVGETYLGTLGQLSRWAEEFGHKGLLLLTNHQHLEPWMLAEVVVRETERLVPVIASQPQSMPPHTLAKKVSSMGTLHGRRVALKAITGGAPEDMAAIDDTLDHDRRYARLEEYFDLVYRLLKAKEPVSFDGEFFRTRLLALRPHLDPDLVPALFVAGGSAGAFHAAAKAKAGAAVVTHPEPLPKFECTLKERLGSAGTELEVGIRLGIIARDTAEQAEAEAARRFRQGRLGRMKVVMKQSSDSEWSRRLADLALGETPGTGVYRLDSFTADHSTNSPYLVGSHREVADYLSGYRRLGVRHVFLDGPYTFADFEHTALTAELVR